MATPTRFERATYRLGICRSILLSYGVPFIFNGLRVELVELDEQGQTSLTIKAKNIQLDPAMSSEQFNFILPRGVNLEDQTQSP